MTPTSSRKEPGEQDRMTHDEQVEALMRIGLTRVQAERELAAAAGKDISDVRRDAQSDPACGES